ncbi:uncharacterized protein B0H18DRAFT_1117630 [Fomitopsis serialis]|uniref:uncharacterized protein n=1 Tax=Fomitopsis serialis TaxID=139415 RepID=UPI002008B8E0|nr:uncharacterized protein B0H18DRAFT_1117630 [Neoantrodia serialis]KAH9929290.1 hypothetical protein B0H18DRAFT_1117630 [Neoantrodia serialis]
MAHLSTAKSCLWYRKGKNKDLWSNLPNVEEQMVEEQALSSAEDMEVDPQENIWDALENRDLFRFVLPDAGTQPATQDENQASSSTHPAVPPDPRVVQAPALDDDEDDRVEEEDSLAGKVIRMDATIVQTWKAFFADDLEDDTSDADQMEVDSEDGRPRGRDRSEVWKPFASELDWRVAMWVVREDVGQKSINRFLSIPGVVEKLGLTFKDVRELLLKVDDIPDRAAWKTASLSFPDRPDEIHLKLLPEGAALAPVIISTDKTQLTQFSGNKTAYPVYLTLGNIPRSIRRKPSQHACILLGYLPVSKVVGDKMTKRERKARSQRLFHEAMSIILKPLVRAGVDGIEVTGGDGAVRRVYPILVAYVADYPEQCLVACSKYGTCPKCQCPADKLAEPVAAEPRTSEMTESIILEASNQGLSDAACEALCMQQNVAGGVKKPFWADLPYTDIHLSITPDVLHQLYQGVFKHLVTWCQDLLGPKELDRRIRSMPPAFGVRHFKHGISSLSQITGTERKGMARILLGCLIGKIPKSLLICFRSLLDFIYLAQYPTHDDDTLGYLSDALKMFHEHKNILVKLGIREHLNIPKFHSLLHYVDSIRLFGTTDNYNTEMFERLHIDLAKDAWRASNHRDEFPQMTRWISRREKMMLYEVFQNERQATEELEDDEADRESRVDELEEREARPEESRMPTVTSESRSFTTALALFVNDLQPRELRLTRQELSQTVLPFDRLDISLRHSWLCSERKKERFDTAIILENNEAESTGVRGPSGAAGGATRPGTRLEPPPKLGGWILLGSILESHRGVDVPPYFRGQGRNVALETFIFFEEAHIPMCLPLVWQIRDDTQEIEISFDQPLTAQIFPSLNRWRGIPRGGRIQFDFFNVKTQTFVPVIRHPLDVPFRLPLPLEFVPVFKISSVTTAAFAEKYSRGTKPLKPMCSMKASFMELKFNGREDFLIRAKPWYGEVAKCARFGEPGYSVAAFISEDWPAAEDGGVPKGSAGGDNAPDEDIGIRNRASRRLKFGRSLRTAERFRTLKLGLWRLENGACMVRCCTIS